MKELPLYITCSYDIVLRINRLSQRHTVLVWDYLISDPQFCDFLSRMVEQAESSTVITRQTLQEIGVDVSYTVTKLTVKLTFYTIENCALVSEPFVIPFGEFSQLALTIQKGKALIAAIEQEKESIASKTGKLIGLSILFPIVAGILTLAISSGLMLKVFAGVLIVSPILFIQVIHEACIKQYLPKESGLLIYQSIQLLKEYTKFNHLKK